MFASYVEDDGGAPPRAYRDAVSAPWAVAFSLADLTVLERLAPGARVWALAVVLSAPLP